MAHKDDVKFIVGLAGWALMWLALGMFAVISVWNWVFG
jgi:hypothetical protein